MSLGTNEKHPVSAAGKAMAPLFASLMSGLHAAAQPLTVLRVRLDEDSIQAMPVEKLRKTAIDAIAPVDRLCALVSSMQLLVTAEYLEPIRSEVEVAALVRGTVEGLDLIFAEKGIDLFSDLPSSPTLMTVDGKRLEEAIVSSLLLVQGISHPGDRMAAEMAIDEAGLRFRVSNVARSVEKLSPENQLALAIAEVDLRSQGGTLTYSPSPLCVELYLPA